MALGNGAAYTEFFFQMLNGEYDLASGQDTMRLMLVTGHTVDLDTHTGYASVSGDEMSGTGYTAGGEALTTQTTTKDTTNQLGVLGADNVTWGSFNAGTPSHAILYDDTHASNLLIANWEVTTPGNTSDYIIQFSAGNNKILSIG